MLSALVVPFALSMRGADPAAATQVATPTAVPSAQTPAVNDGAVYDIVRVGSTMVMGGTFTSVTAPGGAATARTSVAAFNPSTGALTSFAPQLNGIVNRVLPGPTSNTVYLAGNFTKVGSTFTGRVALLDLSTGAPVSGFAAFNGSSQATSLAMASGHLLVGGDFTTVNGVARQGLASVNPTTGALDNFLTVPLAGHHNDTGSGAQGAVGTNSMAITPDKSKLAVIGNFKTAGGLSREQLAVLNLTGSTAVVDTSWRTDGYKPYCYNWAFDTYVRDVSASPDGKYFVVTATGGPNAGTLCDAASRFEFGATGTDIKPTWSSVTGGDTLWGAEVASNAVYVGGHQRWMNNSDGADSAKQGAVPRAGLAALDPDTGTPLAWNPGRNPRGAAAYVVYADGTGLWVGSDTEYIGNRTYTRKRLAYFPNAGGTTGPTESLPALPGTVYLGQADNTLKTMSYDGTTPGTLTTSDPRGISWGSIKGAFQVDDQLWTATTSGTLQRRTFTGATTGTAQTFDPYNDPAWVNVATGSGQTFRGLVPSVFGQFTSLTGMAYSNKRLYYTLAGDSNLYWRNFSADSGIVGSQIFTANAGRSWSDTGGLFISGSQLYIVSKSTGQLARMAFDPASGPSGTASVVNATRDWRGGVVFLGPTTRSNQAPVASFTASCSGRTCSVDASGSTDDGGIASYAWDFGDSGTATGKTAQHAYAADGTFTVKLTVTDSDGATNTTTRSVSPKATAPSSNVSYVGSAQSVGNSTATSVSVPAAVQPGDLLILVGSYGASGAAIGTPTGWTRIGYTAPTGMESYVFVKRAVSGDAGSSVTTTGAITAKAALSLLAYRGAATADPRAVAANDGGGTSHASPTIALNAGDWLVRAWTDKSSATAAWTAPSGVTSRGVVYGSGSGRVSALVTDTNAAQPAGTAGALTATTDAASGRAISWAIAFGGA